MATERNETISVEKDKFSVNLRTEQTIVQNEIFQSVEAAMNNKDSKKWQEIGMILGFGGGGVAAAVSGLEQIISGVERGNGKEVVVGIELVALGIYFLETANRAVDAKRLVSRQLESLKGIASSPTRNKTQLPLP